MVEAPVPVKSPNATQSATRRIERIWQRRGWAACLLWPISLLYGVIMRLRRLAYRLGWLRTQVSALPVVVVGNLSVGGTGKTPLCAALVARFQQAGWHPAIVSRGYGGSRHEQPHLLSETDTAASAGDEPLMLFTETGVPVCVCIDRAAAVAHLASHTDADIVFSDDGLQHLAMSRAAELIVIDGSRGLGNRWLLPAGPLRESAHRLRSADLVAVQVPYTGTPAEVATKASRLHRSLQAGQTGRWLNSVIDQQFQLVPAHARAISSGRTLPLTTWQGQRVHAMAGIGHPQRFFDALLPFGLHVQGHSFPDHHVFSLADLAFADDAPILVTAKDAVKLRALQGLPNAVFEVPVNLQLSAPLAAAIDILERSLRSNQS